MKSAVCMIVKNEERLAPEWIAYHLALGFDACLVYDNGSTDRTAEIVVRAAALGDVRLVSWNQQSFSYQVDAYHHAIRTLGAEFDWIAFIDSDEFIASPSSDNISDLLNTSEDVSGIVLNWAVFGSSGRVARPDGLVIESYLRRAPDDFGPNCHTKMFVNTRSSAQFLNPHLAALDGLIVDVAGAEPQWTVPGVTIRPVLEPWRVNHYFTRSREDWDIKMTRGYPNVERRTGAEFAGMDRNDVVDESLLRFADRVRALVQVIVPDGVSDPA